MTPPFRAPAAAPTAASSPRQSKVAAPTAEARAALAWLHGARFLTTASKLDQLPADELPEIAFVGRSNAGKSTAINRLTQQKRLAFASRTPGRTQHINLFDVGPRDAVEVRLADLPGYGYAAVARTAKLRWQEVMAQYLERRRSLHGVVLMADSRLGLTELDQRLLALMSQRIITGEVRLLVLLTKVDKLNRNDAQKALRDTGEALADLGSEASDIGITTFSALSGQGLGDVAEALRSWVPAAVAPAQAEPAAAPAAPPVSP
jgi:GTP-binding protein